jgi:hypothetical protein
LNLRFPEMVIRVAPAVRAPPTSRRQKLEAAGAAFADRVTADSATARNERKDIIVNTKSSGDGNAMK